MKDYNKTLVIGHRGSSALFPENSRESFEMAFQEGYNGIELDVHQTKDNHLVVIHDETTGRTGDKDLSIEKSTLSELMLINFNKNFDSSAILGKKEPYLKKTPETIMTLEEFLEKFTNKFEVINLEVKTDVIHYKGIEKRVLNALEKYKDKSHFILSSFNINTITILRELNKEVVLGYLIHDEEAYTNVSEDVFIDVHNMCQYIHVLDELYFKDKNILDKFDLPYVTWQWRREKEIGDYSEIDRQKYFYSMNEKNIFAQIVDYKWKK